jgi:hypothetical protein
MNLKILETKSNGNYLFSSMERKLEKRKLRKLINKFELLYHINSLIDICNFLFSHFEYIKFGYMNLD